jgi:GNAT superfamily N-acetyltransferase
MTGTPFAGADGCSLPEDERMVLFDVFAAAADGRLPPPDGQVEVRSGLSGRAAAVVAFPAHFYVLAPVDPRWVRETLPPGDYSAPLGARFLVALADRIGAHIGASDAVLAAFADGRDVGVDLREITDGSHPRIRRAHRYRDEVRAWRTNDGRGHVVLGRGLAGRWEVSFEVEPAARGRGLGRDLAAAALGLLPVGTPVFAQVSPGNSVSLRATLAAGYRPIGGEVLLPSRQVSPAAAPASRNPGGGTEPASPVALEGEQGDVHSMRTVSSGAGGPSQTRNSRPQSSPRAPTVVTSQPGSAA